MDFLVSLATYVFAGSAEIRITLIMDPPAVCAAVQEMLTAIRTEVSTCQPAADGDSEHLQSTPYMDATAEREVVMDGSWR